METAICKHEEDIRHAGGGIDVGVCRLCGQVRHYDNTHAKLAVLVKVLGRIDGKVVLPSFGERVAFLSDLDQHDLAAAQQSIKAVVPAALLPEVEGVPARPKKRKELRGYYEENKEAVLRDYYSKRLLDFLRDWHLSVAYWTKLKKEWQVKPKERPRPVRKTPTAKPSLGPGPGPRAVLPAFPEFDSSWPELVQLRWFDTYRALVELIKGAE